MLEYFDGKIIHLMLINEKIYCYDEIFEKCKILGVALCLSSQGRRNGEALVLFDSLAHRDMALK